jgi:hypothetical protein
MANVPHNYICAWRGWAILELVKFSHTVFAAALLP